MLRGVSTVVVAFLAATLAFVYGLHEVTSRLSQSQHGSHRQLVTFLDFDAAVGYSRLSLHDGRLLEDLLGVEIFSLAIEEFVLGENASGQKVRVAIVTHEAAEVLGIPVHYIRARETVALVRSASMANSVSGTIRFGRTSSVFDAVSLADDVVLPAAFEDIDVIVVDDMALLLDTEMVEQLEGETRAAFRLNQPNRILFANVDSDSVGRVLQQRYDNVEPLRNHSVKWETLLIAAEIGTRSGEATLVALEGLWGDPKWKRAFESSGSSSVLILWITLIAGAVTYALIQVLRSAEQRERLRLLTYLGAPPWRLADEVLGRLFSTEAIASSLGALAVSWAMVELFETRLGVPTYLVPDVVHVISVAVPLSLLLLVSAGLVQAAWLYVETASGAIFNARQNSTPLALILFGALCCTLVVALFGVVPIGLDLRRNLQAAGEFPVDSLYFVETEHTQFPPPLSGAGILQGLNDQLLPQDAGTPASVALMSGLPPFEMTTSVLIHPVAEQNTRVQAVRVLGSTHFFEIAGIPMVSGNTFSTAPGYGLVLSESLAVSLFGSASDSVGRGVVMAEGNQLITFSVAGVAQDIPEFEHIVYRSTDISSTSQIWTSKLLVRSVHDAARLGELLAPPLRLAGLRAVRIVPLQDLLNDLNRPKLVAVLVFASLICLLTVVMLIAIIASVLSIVRANRLQLTLLWRLGARESLLITRTLGGVLVAWAVGTLLGALLTWRSVDGLLRVSDSTSAQAWIGAALALALLVILVVAMYTARLEIRRVALTSAD